MAIVEHIPTGRQTRLRTNHLVGRSDRADLTLDDRRVSTEHATLRWTGRAWIVRDLGSRNGTWVDGKRLEKGGSAVVEAGGVVAFGSDDPCVRLVDAAAPGLLAVGPDGVERSGVRGMLALPDDDEPAVVIVRSGEDWVVEDADGERVLADGESVEVGGGRWTVTLPEAPEQTWASDDGAEVRLADIGLHFRVSLDEEHVELAVDGPSGRQELGSRAHHYLLLTLARLRLEDADRDDLPESAKGWVPQERLEKMLARKGGALHIAVFRARKELADLGVADGREVVQRRKGSRQLRLGVGQISVQTI